MTKPIGLSRDEIEVFLAQDFPQIFVHGKIWEILACAPKAATMRMAYHESQLRPGGTISGPAMMTLGDLALYVALLATIGHVPLAVTTSFTINFLRKPEPRPLIGECRLLKVGRRLAMGEVALRSEGETDLVAHITGTYAIP